MSLLAKLTVTPLLYACAGLFAALLATGAYAAVLDARLGTAQAHAATATADRNTARTERDAWKGSATDLTAANVAYGAAVTTLITELERAQAETTRIEAAGQQAVANAQAAAADADRALALMTAQLQAQARQSDCARALDQLVRACPRFEGY